MTLQQAQTAFRASPSRATALAYMDAAVAEWEEGAHYSADYDFLEELREIRDWLMNERTP